MQKSLFILLQTLSLGACVSKNIDTTRKLSSQESSQIQIAVDMAQKEGGLPGVAVLAWKKDQVQYFNSQGKRSLQKEAKVTSLDKWHLGSNTKAMTAFLIALAVQEGKISYDSKLMDLGGGGIPFHPLNGDLTVSDLLTHGSGLKDVQEIEGGRLWKALFISQKSLVQQRDEMMRAALKEAPHLDPKSSNTSLRQYSYSNVNYIILGSILEKIYKSEWESLVNSNLFQALNMNSCGFGVAGNPTETEPSQPWPHILDKGKLIGVPPKEKLDNPPMLGPAGTIHCNLEDWRKFTVELTKAWGGRGHLLKDKDVISRYFTNAHDSFYTYGGWVRVDDKYRTVVYAHDGSNTFNYAVVLFSPEENTGLLLATNSGSSEATAAIGKLKKFLAEEILSK